MGLIGRPLFVMFIGLFCSTHRDTGLPWQCMRWVRVRACACVCVRVGAGGRRTRASFFLFCVRLGAGGRRPQVSFAILQVSFATRVYVGFSCNAPVPRSLLHAHRPLLQAHRSLLQRTRPCGDARRVGLYRSLLSHIGLFCLI